MPRRLIALSVVLVSMSTTLFAQQPDANWAAATATEVCFSCHAAMSADAGGENAGLVPKLMGQRPSYIESALRSYRGSGRDQFFMRGVASGLSASEITALADHFGRNSQTSGAGGEQAANTSKAPTVVERCMVCHVAPTSENRNALFPVLHGQNEAYLSKALADYLSGRRKEQVMRSVLVPDEGKAAFSDAELSAAVHWFAVRPGLTQR
jgi:cytochrome c553